MGQSIHLAKTEVPGSIWAFEHAGDSAHTAVQTWITARQNISPKRLVEPGPSLDQIDRLFNAAASAPDHGQIIPWRFVIIPAEKRAQLAEVFALALLDRDPGASLAQIEAAREKAHRAPLLVLAVARLGKEDNNIPEAERLVSLGCAIQNILLSALATGFGSGLTSGQAMDSAQMRAMFALTSGEAAVCFVNVGSVSKSKPARERPLPERFLTVL